MVEANFENLIIGHKSLNEILNNSSEYGISHSFFNFFITVFVGVLLLFFLSNCKVLWMLSSITNNATIDNCCLVENFRCAQIHLTEALLHLIYLD